MKMTKMNELEAPPRAPTGTPAAGQHPSIYRRFCCQVVFRTGPSLPASPALLGPTCPQAAAASLPAPQAQSSRHAATSGSMSKFCRNDGYRGCHAVTIQVIDDPRSTIILISTLSHNEYGECSKLVA